MKLIFIILFLLLHILLSSCTKYPPGVQETLNLSGENKQELIKVLKYFQKKDTTAYQAACYLIDHMKWHSNKTYYHNEESVMIPWLLKADSLLYSFVISESYDRNKISGKIKESAPGFQKKMWSEMGKFSAEMQDKKDDCQFLTARFLIGHIENALEQWQNSPFSSHLTFDEFCQFILPYRSLNKNSFVMNGKELNTLFHKYIQKEQDTALWHIVNRYNFYISGMRKIMGENPLEEPIGFPGIFFNIKFDCIEQADLETNFLRANGIPVAIDYNIGNREFVGQHHHCVIPDKDRMLHPFNPEASFPRGKSWGYRADLKLNIYRSTFDAQPDSPYFIKLPGEQLPEEFQTPCLKDVTSYIKDVYPLELAVDGKGNNLLWLYTFANNAQGMRPVTWGVAEGEDNKYSFRHIVPDMLYFPCIIDHKGEPVAVSEPIYIQLNFKKKVLEVLPLSMFYDTLQPRCVNLHLTRKFPVKPNMQESADKMKGGRFYGALKEDLSDTCLLYTIAEPPKIGMNEYFIRSKRAWKYFVYQAPGKQASNISILEYLTDKSRKYPETAVPTPLEITCPEDKLINEHRKVKILSAKHTNEPENDGNMQTSSGKKRLLFEAIQPVALQSVRLAPKNADNGIKPNEDYELMAWEDGWKSVLITKSLYNYLDFQKLPSGGLYWLRNHSRGKEEVPFLIIGRKPAFIYYDVMIAPDYEKISKSPRTDWKVSASSEEPDSGPYEAGYARFAIDDDLSTWWHTQYTGKRYNFPHWISIDMGKMTFSDGFFLTNRGRDVPRNFVFETSSDGIIWEDTLHFRMYEQGDEQLFFFKESKKFRFFRITFTDGYSANPYISMREIGTFVRFCNQDGLSI